MVEKEKIVSKDEILKDLNEYNNFKKELLENKYNKKTVKSFKLYYDSLQLSLIEYIRKNKDKELSEMSKGLKTSKELFGEMYKWIGIQTMVMVFPTVALLNLWFLKINRPLLMVGFVVNAIIVFFLIKKVQSIPKKLTFYMDENGEVCKKIVKHLKNVRLSLN